MLNPNRMKSKNSEIYILGKKRIHIIYFVCIVYLLIIYNIQNLVYVHKKNVRKHISCDMFCVTNIRKIMSK